MGVITAPKAVITALISGLLWFGAAALAFMDWCNGVDIILPWGGIPPVIVKPA